MLLKHKSGKVHGDLDKQLARDLRASRGQTWDVDSGQPHLLHRPATQGTCGLGGGDPKNKVGSKWPDQGFYECSVEELESWASGV